MQITANELARRLRAADDILLLTHCRPDGDTVGSAAALCRVLRQAGKTAFVLPNPDITEMNAGYLSAFLAPEGFAPRCVAAVDMAARSLFTENAAAYRDAVDLAVDHHPSQEFFAKDTCLDTGAAACGEIVYELCRALGKLDAETASYLYAAIATDTGCFVYSNTTPRTHRIAAALMETGFDAAAVNKRHFRTKTKKRLLLEAALVDGMRLYDRGRVVVMSIPLSLMARIGATENDADELSSLAALVEGTDCGVTLRELTPEVWKVSLRTGKRVNATKACGLLGGGGHAAAAGCTLAGSEEAVTAQILAAIAEAADG